MKRHLSLLMILCWGILLHAQTESELSSPNGEIKVTLNITDKIYYSIAYDGDVLLKDNSLQLALKDEVLGQNPRLRRRKYVSVDEQLTPVMPLKFSTVTNQYNQLTLTFKNYSVEFRAYDDGVAYRFVTSRKGEVEVLGEEFAVNFPDDYLLHLQQPGGFKTSYEEPYTHVSSNEWKPSDKMSVLPVLIDTRKQYKILISESDLTDYPCMFLKGTGDNGIVSTFPKAPLAFGEDGDRSLKITQEADYIAKTSGARNYPWRYFVLTKDDRQLLENTMTYKLAGKNQLQDVSWIKPGQVSWEWWNDASPYGPDVNFVSGYNLETYKYYIDFASKFGIEYVILDEGWAVPGKADLFEVIPEIDLKELISYAKSKNVDLILWAGYRAFEKDMDRVCKHYAAMGIKGFKIDFMDRDDQQVVEFNRKAAETGAKYKLLIDLHGTFKPTGLQRTYPNTINFEGVHGLEEMKWAEPGTDQVIYDVTAPFIRMVAGPLDYTQGAMNNVIMKNFHAVYTEPMSQGTRCRQLALYTIFDSPINMLCDAPTNYLKEEECTKFIAAIPTVWNQTLPISGKVGEHIVMAREKDGIWYVGGLTDWKERDVEVDLSFLGDGEFNAEIFRDGINADRVGKDYKREVIRVLANKKLKLHMAPGGGFVVKITK